MLEIRQAQLDAFHDLPDDFVALVLRRVARSHAPHVGALGEPRAHRLIERTVAHGLQHGVRSGVALVELCELALEFGERFVHSPDQASALDLLEHRTLPESLKLEVLREHLRARTRGRKHLPPRSA